MLGLTSRPCLPQACERVLRCAFTLQRMLEAIGFILFAINWMFAPPPSQFIYGKLIPNVMLLVDGAFCRWLGHEDGTLVNGINDIMKETSECSLAPAAMWGFSKKVIDEIGNRLSPVIESVNAWILESSASLTVRKKCFLFKPPSLCYFLYISSKGHYYLQDSCMWITLYVSRSISLFVKGREFELSIRQDAPWFCKSQLAVSLQLPY